MSRKKSNFDEVMNTKSKISFKVGKRQLFIHSDDMQWFLSGVKTTKNKKTGEDQEEWDHIGYYSTLKGALNGAFEKKLRNSDYQSFHDILKNTETIRQEMLGYYDSTL